MFHSAENLILLHHWDVDQNVGRKFVISSEAKSGGYRNLQGLQFTLW